MCTFTDNKQGFIDQTYRFNIKNMNPTINNRIQPARTRIEKQKHIHQREPTIKYKDVTEKKEMLPIEHEWAQQAKK